MTWDSTHNGKCLKKRGQKNLCSSSKEFDFFLEQKNHGQIFEIWRKGKKALSHQTKARLHLKSPHVYFGKAIHLIRNVKNSSYLYLLIRELEQSSFSNLPLRQTVNLFRFQKGQFCHLAESDMTNEKDQYLLLVEFARSLGEGLDCPEEAIQI